MQQYSHPYPRLERFLEILPAAISILTLLLPFLLTPFFPYTVAALIIFYYVWWFWRSLHTSILLISSYRKFCSSLDIDWNKKLKNLNQDLPYQVVLIAAYKEPLNLLRETLRTWSEQNYPKEKIMLVLALEAREGEEAVKKQKILEKEFAHKFGHWFTTFHPADIPGEVKGRGSNTTWAMQTAEKKIAELGWEEEKTLVSTVDADSQSYPSFLSYLSYTFLTTKDAQYKSYQPLPFYLNNLWRAHSFARLMAIGSTLFHLSNTLRPGEVKNFSAFTYTLWQLKRIGYYPTDTPVEDYRTYYRAYVRNYGRTDVVPLYMPISMDAVEEDGFGKTVKAQYIQIRRWASGASHLAWFVPRVVKDWKKFPKLRTLWEIWYNLFLSSWTWATAPLLLFYGARAPLMNTEFAQSIVGHNLPIVAAKLMTLMLIGIFISFLVNLLIIHTFNRYNPKYKPNLRLRNILEWIIIPIMTIVFGAIPALDAQIRLALGKIVTFEVTKKKR